MLGMEIVLFLPTLLLCLSHPERRIMEVKRIRYRQCDRVDKALPLQPEKNKTNSDQILTLSLTSYQMWGK